MEWGEESEYAAAARLFRFGVFELAEANRELRKEGRPVRLHRKSGELLLLLLESAGTIVAREEIWQRLWPASTCVEFEHALNVTVIRLRQALGDSAGEPHFFETIARRGCRFVAPVEAVDLVLRQGARAVSGDYCRR